MPEDWFVGPALRPPVPDVESDDQTLLARGMFVYDAQPAQRTVSLALLTGLAAFVVDVYLYYPTAPTTRAHRLLAMDPGPPGT